MKKFLLAAFAVFLAYAVPTTAANAGEFSLNSLSVTAPAIEERHLDEQGRPVVEVIRAAKTIEIPEIKNGTPIFNGKFKGGKRDGNLANGEPSKQYSVEVPYDATSLFVNISWTPMGADQVPPARYDDSRQQPYNCWYCAPAGPKPVTVSLSFQPQTARVFWADKPTAEFGVPADFKAGKPGIAIRNGVNTFVDAQGSRPPFLIIKIEYKAYLHFSAVSGMIWWENVDTTTYKYVIKVDRATGPGVDKLVNIKVPRRRGEKEEFGRIKVPVKLNKAPTEPITVRWWTEDGADNLVRKSGTAKPARGCTLEYSRIGTERKKCDYITSSGTLRFTPTGDLKQHFTIQLLDDSMDDSSEYFKINYSSPDVVGSNKKALFVNQGVERTHTWGIIWNSDPLPGEYLSKLGHTVGGQIVDAISNRVKEDLKPGVDITGAKQSIIQNQLLPGTNFSISDSNLSVWGRTAYDTFDGNADGLDMSGSVLTATLATDIELDKMLLGLAVHFSKGRGKFGSDVDDGDIESTLTTFTPYARYNITKNLLVWGLAGYGFGKLEIGGNAPLKTDISMLIGAAGARGELLNQEDYGLDLALKTDAFYVRMKSDKAEAVETTTNTYRFRVGFEGSRRFEISQNSSFRPHLELGFRYDGGDIDSGLGVEIKGGADYNINRFSLGVDGNYLLTHTNSNFKEWGVGVTAHLKANKRQRGLSFRLSPQYGLNNSTQLWNRPFELAGVEREQQSLGFGIETEIGYGVSMFGDRFTATPNVGFRTNGGIHEYKIGYRLNSVIKNDPGFELNFDATTDNQSNQSLMLRGVISW